VEKRVERLSELKGFFSPLDSALPEMYCLPAAFGLVLALLIERLVSLAFWATIIFGIILVLLIGIQVFLGFMIIVTALWEKRPVNFYCVPEAGQELPPTQRAESANEAAEARKFQHKGVYHHAKGGIYRVRYDIWLSSDQLTLAVVGGGKLARIPVNAVWLYSRLEDGRFLATTNDSGSAELSGLTKLKIHKDFEVDDLLDYHLDRLDSLSVAATPYSTTNPLADLIQDRSRMAERQVELGYASFLEPHKETWRYTLKGALRLYYLKILVEMFKHWGLVKSKEHRSASRKRRTNNV
jgi:hypothetical protein